MWRKSVCQHLHPFVGVDQQNGSCSYTDRINVMCAIYTLQSRHCLGLLIGDVYLLQSFMYSILCCLLQRQTVWDGFRDMFENMPAISVEGFSIAKWEFILGMTQFQGFQYETGYLHPFSI